MGRETNEVDEPSWKVVQRRQRQAFDKIGKRKPENNVARLLFAGHSAKELYEEARADALAIYGGYYETQDKPPMPHRKKGMDRLRLNALGIKLYDIWFSPTGRTRLLRLICIVRDPSYYIENGNEVLEGLVNYEHIVRERPFYNLAGAILRITDRPDGIVIAEYRWGHRDERIG